MTNQHSAGDAEKLPLLAVLTLGPVAIGCLAVAVLTAAGPLDAHAVADQQLDSAEITWAPCVDCRIVLDSIARISDGGGADLSPYAALAVDSRGSIFVGSLQTGGNIYLFAPDGRFQRTVGVTGATALRTVTGIHVGRGDTILVMDAMSRWLDRLSWEGAFIDRMLLPGGIMDWSPIGGQRLFVSAAVPTRDKAGYPLHIVDVSGMVRSFGEQMAVRGSGDRGRLFRYVARGRKSVWAGNRLSYRIEEWTLDGHRTSVRTRNVAWFPPLDELPPSPQVARPSATMRGLHDSEDGYLWVYLHVADEDWRHEPLAPAPVPGMFVALPVLDPFLDTVIELIDLDRNVAVARFRDDRAHIPVGNGYLASYEEDGDGQATYRVWRPRLMGGLPFYPPC